MHQKLWLIIPFPNENNAKKTFNNSYLPGNILKNWPMGHPGTVSFLLESFNSADHRWDFLFPSSLFFMMCPTGNKNENSVPTPMQVLGKSSPSPYTVRTVC